MVLGHPSHDDDWVGVYFCVGSTLTSPVSRLTVVQTRTWVRAHGGLRRNRVGYEVPRCRSLLLFTDSRHRLRSHLSVETKGRTRRFENRSEPGKTQR